MLQLTGKGMLRYFFSFLRNVQGDNLKAKRLCIEITQKWLVLDKNVTPPQRHDILNRLADH